MSTSSTTGGISYDQTAALQRLLTYLDRNSPFYREHFEKHNIDISTIRGQADLSRIKPTTKDDLHQRNWDFLCISRENVAEYCTTSGTLGDFVTIALSSNDLDRLARNEAASLAMMDCSNKDVFQLMLTLDRQFMAGIAYYSGIVKAGGTVIRVGPGNLDMQLDTIHRLKPTVLVGVPGFILQMVTYAHETGIDLNKTSIKKILCIGESIRNSDFTLNAAAARISSQWSAALYSTYASTEMQTAFTECSYGRGGHLNPELLVFEVLDDSDCSLPPGVPGELAITTLGIEGMPLLRYKTGDICTWHNDPCPCGRDTPRLGPVLGRKQQQIKYRGTTVYPPAVFNALNAIPEVADYIVEISRDETGADDLHLSIAISPHLHCPRNKIADKLQAALRTVPRITYRTLAEIQQLHIAEGKRKLSRVIDRRPRPDSGQ